MGAALVPSYTVMQRSSFMYRDLLRNETASLIVPVIGGLVLLYCVWHSDHAAALSALMRGEERLTGL